MALRSTGGGSGGSSFSMPDFSGPEGQAAKKKLIFAGVALLIGLVLLGNAAGLYSFSSPPAPEPVPADKQAALNAALERDRAAAEKFANRKDIVKTGGGGTVEEPK